ncbi:hypothetical protein M7I_5791 [Glarea lozoyensis 74030]|uniref:Uncharacterized protein n=1 Tax=Glarea lozoyensis (strain ATCC 74030 / MF5533) TaxID=1104152 RepID=H0ESU4_GLAL7|nr:hypothetical protein M7I_5791 [Glarea lozoyensis 74030]
MDLKHEGEKSYLKYRSGFVGSESNDIIEVFIKYSLPSKPASTYP